MKLSSLGEQRSRRTRIVILITAVGCLALLAGTLLIIGPSGGQDRVAVFGDDDTFLPWALVTDGEFVWKSVDRSSGFGGVAEVVKIDSSSGEVEWRNEYGVGSYSDLVLSGATILATYKQPLQPKVVASGDEVLILVDAETGDVVRQVEIPRISTSPIVVGDTVWLLGQDPGVYIRDVETLDLVETIEFSSITNPDGRPVTGLTQMTLFGDTMWITDGRVFAGVDTTSHEMVDFVDLDEFGLNVLEGHDGVLWSGDRGDPDEGAVGYDPESGEIIRSGFYESPIGNVYHGGYTYDMVSESTMIQVDNETGERVATFTELDPFSVVVTDGFLWAKDDTPRDEPGRKIFRYETEP